MGCLRILPFGFEGSLVRFSRYRKSLLTCFKVLLITLKMMTISLSYRSSNSSRLAVFFGRRSCLELFECLDVVAR